MWEGKKADKQADRLCEAVSLNVNMLNSGW